MEPKDRKHLTDEWLESALRKQGDIEPRPGLENRILAVLEAERKRVPQSLRNWRPAWLALAIAAVVLTILTLRRPVPKAIIAAHPPITSPAALPPNTTPASPTITRTRHAHARRTPKIPRLDQFPAPQPLTEQEQILAQYVQRYPQSARLLARARTALLRQEMNSPDGSTQTTQISDQQN
jgi:hypothetical protein